MKKMSELNLPGKLFAVEGIDGSGKSTQIALLNQWLLNQGYGVFFSEWNSSNIVKSTTRRGKKKKLLTPTTFSLVHATDFADRMDRQILPPLKAGAIVLADRFFYTAFARDITRGVSSEWVRTLYSFAIEPTVTFYFKVPLDIAMDRILAGRAEIKYYEGGMDLGLATNPEESFRIFQGKILEQYEKLVEEFGLTVIDATLPINDQQHIMRTIVMENIKSIKKFPKSTFYSGFNANSRN